MIQKKLERSTEWGKKYEEIYVKNIEIGSLHNSVTFIVVTTLSNFFISLSSLGRSF